MCEGFDGSPEHLLASIKRREFPSTSSSTHYTLSSNQPASLNRLEIKVLPLPFVTICTRDTLNFKYLGDLILEEN